MLDVQKNEYLSGSIWEFLTEEEEHYIKSVYDILIKFKDNTDLVTYLHASYHPHPKRVDSSYYDRETFNEIKQFVDMSGEIAWQPHQQNKLLHNYLSEVEKRFGLEHSYFENTFYKIMDNIAAKIINYHYNKNITGNDFVQRAQLAWYTEGDFIKMHDDGPSNDRVCALLIYLTPKEFYKIGNGGELVLKNRHNTIDIVYPILGNYAIIDFTKNSPVHSVHKIMGDFNRFSYLNFVEIKNV
jgi:Rps23 Pro-64 3,4-dihydroxylase Tpa1-like proline 4-hydroxylase